MKHPADSRFRGLSIALTGVAALLCAALSGCGENMSQQPHYEYYEAVDFFKDGMVARTPPEGAVARDNLRSDTDFYEGIRADGSFTPEFPLPVTERLLLRGQERYNIHCSVCHGPVGEGDGMIVRRGFPAPPSFHEERLMEAPTGYLFHVMTDGYGVMYPYRARVSVEDRWAIAAYIRALQLSQHVPVEELSPPERQKLEQEVRQ